MKKEGIRVLYSDINIFKLPNESVWKAPKSISSTTDESNWRKYSAQFDSTVLFWTARESWNWSSFGIFYTMLTEILNHEKEQLLITDYSICSSIHPSLYPSIHPSSIHPPSCPANTECFSSHGAYQEWGDIIWSYYSRNNNKENKWEWRNTVQSMCANFNRRAGMVSVSRQYFGNDLKEVRE